VAPNSLRLSLTWEPVGTIMSGVETDGIVDIEPMTTVDLIRKDRKHKTQVRLVLPGSGIKGALRSRAELIARTVGAGRTDPTTADDGQPLPVIRHLFGAAARSQSGVQHGLRGAVAVPDCRSRSIVPREQWNGVVRFSPTDGPPRESPADARRRIATEYDAAVQSLNRSAQDLHFEVVDRVAVDRWTGGAAEGLLFAALEPASTTWEDITIDVDLARVPAGDPRADAIAVLLLAARDMAHGLVPLGRGTRRGWGAVRVTSVTLRAGSAIEELSGASPDVLTDVTAVPELIAAWFSRATGATS
jgi:CRISPR/Cas system CSM-associated protein Csm3 (group 7 of RAMP superfamily)